MKFLLHGGDHNENEMTYSKGEVVESPHDLVEIFGKKFEKVGDDTEAKKPPVIPGPKNLVAKDSKGVKASKDAGKADSGSSEDTPEAPKGEDVSADFEGTVKLGLKVMKISPRRFNIIDPDEANKAINDAPIPQEQVVELLKKYLEA